MAAVVLPEGFDASGINDSKLIPTSLRTELALRIQSEANWSIVIVSQDEIDRINILNATRTAMSEAISALNPLPPEAIVDGDKLPHSPPCPTTYLVKGDQKNAAIAAASILAKTERDRIMTAADSEYPGYGFASHFGYHCQQHVSALKLLGPCAIHRKSFEPIKSMVNQPCFNLEG